MKRRDLLQWAAGSVVTLTLGGCGAGSSEINLPNTYGETRLVASSSAYGAAMVNPGFVNAWGLALRPAGQGGHFWVTASGTSFEFVGDVGAKPLTTDSLKTVALPKAAANVGSANGVVFNGGSQFVITQNHANGAITAPAKFIFVSDNGVLSAWTERKRPDGSFDWPDKAQVMWDGSAQGSSLFGLAITTGAQEADNKLIAVDFGSTPRLRVFNARFQEEPLNGRFPNPFARAAGGFQVGDTVPFNVQTLLLGGVESVFVTYTNTEADPENPGQFMEASEALGQGKGRLVQYTRQGQLIKVWDDQGFLNGPWGLVVAPPGFGPFSGQVLVGNFTNGHLIGFDPQTQRATGLMRDAKGEILKIDGLWGLAFGNGEALGDANALYYAAGPAGEADGLMGALRWGDQELLLGTFD
jgi:uncharacterized protein (TIGR03118 family)